MFPFSVARTTENRNKASTGERRRARDGSVGYRHGMQRFRKTTTPDISGAWLLH
jgi:hypothetical protein